MAYVVKKILDGPRHVIVHVYFRSDGQELVDEVLIDPKTELSPVCKKMVTETILYSLRDVSGRLTFDSGVPDETFIWVLPEIASSCVDFKDFGGLTDWSELDGTGKLMFSTIGLATSDTAEGSIIIKLRKKN